MNRGRVPCDACGEPHVAGNGLSIHRRIVHGLGPQDGVPPPSDDLYADGWDDGYNRALVDLASEIDRVPPTARGAVGDLISRLRYQVAG